MQLFGFHVDRGPLESSVHFAFMAKNEDVAWEMLYHSFDSIFGLDLDETPYQVRLDVPDYDNHNLLWFTYR